MLLGGAVPPPQGAGEEQTDAGGTAVELTAGDVLVLPKGWSGRWDILEPVRKLYVIAR